MAPQIYDYQAQQEDHADANGWIQDPNLATNGDPLDNIDAMNYTNHMNAASNHPAAYAMNDANDEASGFPASANASAAGELLWPAANTFDCPSYEATYIATDSQIINETPEPQNFGLAGMQHWNPAEAQGVPILDPQQMVAAPPPPPPPSDSYYASYNSASGHTPTSLGENQWGIEGPNSMAMGNMEQPHRNFWGISSSMAMRPDDNLADSFSVGHAIAHRSSQLGVVPASTRPAPLNASISFIGESPGSKHIRRRVGRPRKSPIAPNSHTALAIDARTKARSMERKKKAAAGSTGAT